MGRVSNSVRNAGVGVAGHFLDAILQFICRSVFIYCLSAEYLGVNGLFTNILSVLSLSDLGFSTAIAYSLYDPIAKKDENKIVQLMNLYRIVYTCVAGFILIVGLTLIPFLPSLIADQPDIPNITLLYVLYLLDTTCSYLLTYKRTIIEANQKSYICTMYRQAVGIAQHILKIVFLLLTHNFIIYLLIQIFSNLISNILISLKADKLYPYLKKKNLGLPEKSEMRVIVKNTSAMSFHKLGSVVVNSTDNILISAIVGLNEVGLYSNYSLIMTNIVMVLNIVFNGITASIGNLVSKETQFKIQKTYDTLSFLGFWIYSFCTASLFILYDPFITIWVGDKYTLPKAFVLLLCVKFYLFGLRQVNQRFKEAMGLMWQDRYKPIFESIINLVASIYLGSKYGMAGILMGTLLSSILTSSWVEPYVVYKYGLKISPLLCLKKYFVYTLGFVLATIVTATVCSMIPISLLGFIIKGISVLLIYNICMVLLFHRTVEYKECFSIVVSIIRKKRNDRC